MMLIVKGKKVCFVGLVTLLLSLFSTSFGQIYCGGIYIICDVGDCICTNDENRTPFQARCAQPNQALLLSGDEDAFDADYAAKVTGKVVTIEDLKKDTALKAGLKSGKIRTKDGKIITFTPIDKVKTNLRSTVLTTQSFTTEKDKTIRTVPSTTTNPTDKLKHTNLIDNTTNVIIQPIEINQMSLEYHFNKIRLNNSTDKALENYRNLLTDMFIKTPPTFLELLGNKYLLSQKYEDAIKVFELYAEINKDSINAYFGLARAYENSYYTNKDNTEHKEKAIKNYELVLNNKTDNQSLKNSASAKLNSLKR